MAEFQAAVEHAKLYTEVQAACAALELAKAQHTIAEKLELELGYMLKMVSTIASVIEYDS